MPRPKPEEMTDREWLHEAFDNAVVVWHTSYPGMHGENDPDWQAMLQDLRAERDRIYKEQETAIGQMALDLADYDSKESKK